MKKIVYKRGKFIVYDLGDELLVVNTSGAYRNHAHLTKEYVNKGSLRLGVAKTLIDLVIKQKVPRSDYLKVSALRLTTSKTYRAKLEVAISWGSEATEGKG